MQLENVMYNKLFIMFFVCCVEEQFDLIFNIYIKEKKKG